ncbi:MAG: hypothetical protein ACI8P2_002280 [Candidatus Latescibacterota bacterium]|jgi:hypothetical protein
MSVDVAAAYSTNGFYVHRDPLLPSAAVEAACAGMDAVRHGQYDTGKPPLSSPWNPGDDEGILCKVEMPQRADRAIGALIGHEELGRWAARVTGAQWVQVWWVQLLYKPPSLPDATQVNVGWHQDRHYWGAWEEGSELFTAWVALSEVEADSGPMRFVCGSQRWGELSGGDFFGQNLQDQQEAIALPAGAEWREESALMAAGGVSFHDCLTLHGSAANTSSAPRRSFAIHMRTNNSRPHDGRHEGLTQFIDDPSLCPVIYG